MPAFDSGENRPKSQIAEFYAGKTVFLTGVTGFLGKIVLAQLFTFCPEIKKVFCLIRGRSGVSAAARFEKEVFSLELFTRLIKRTPSLKDKVQVRSLFLLFMLSTGLPSAAWACLPHPLAHSY